MPSKVLRAAVTVATIALILSSTATAVVQEASREPFVVETWARTDRPVAQGRVDRTWMWGPQPITAIMQEAYVQAPDGRRAVQYFDKSRMEITFPDQDPESIWYVTNGLLAWEMITGQVQAGDSQFEESTPAEVNVAGDPDDPNAPTYATMNELLDAPALGEGVLISGRLHRSGEVTDDPTAFNQYEVTPAYLVPETGHQVASPFWEFMTSSGTVYQDGEYQQARLFRNPFFATGFPITEAYWTTVQVDGEDTDVLMQCFERRCLTYTPSNPAGWQVESGNVGRHYYRWRYGEAPPSNPVSESWYASEAFELSLQYPADWTLFEGSSAITIANQELDCASCSAIPEDVVIMNIRRGFSEEVSGGEPFDVGLEQHPGTLYVEGEDRRLLVIHYTVNGQQWEITGYFGAPADQSNPLTETFYEIVGTIQHQSSSGQ